MKKVLSIISSVSIFVSFTTSVWVYESKPASAFCVHNLTGGPIYGKDHLKHWRGDGLWEKNMREDEKDCCPGKNRECQDRLLKIESRPGGKGEGSCLLRPGNHGLVEVRYSDYKMHCIVI